MKTSELLEIIEDQKELEQLLGLSRTQAWRVFNGKAELNAQASELLKLKKGKHETHKLVKK